MQAHTVAVFGGLVLALSSMTGISRSDEPALVPLHRFYNKQLNVHVYTYLQDELVAWRNLPHMKEQNAVGYVSVTEEPGTVRLWRAVRSDGKHHFYVEAPKKAPKDVRIESESFRAYVWKYRGDGRVPVYGNTWPDGTDVFLDRDKKNVDKYADDTKKALGVTRANWGLAFYVYPKPPQESSVKEQP